MRISLLSPLARKIVLKISSDLSSDINFINSAKHSDFMLLIASSSFAGTLLSEIAFKSIQILLIRIILLIHIWIIMDKNTAVTAGRVYLLL